ncbi:MAG: CDF family Co(II)/Ni(II) efflux transporter DmeF [Gammaproteobacteria bacterium]
MHSEDHSAWMHEHVFDTGNAAAERGTRAVMWITAVAMVIEIAAGWWFNSMALLADGWHMSSHALAIGLSTLAYAAARHYARDPRFAFGTWKIEVLGGFASAVFLLAMVALMLLGSVERLVSPQAIRYREAIAVAFLGLAVNVVCALILGRAHRHDPAHAHGHEAPPARHHDLNLKSAYLHVLADAATSVLAIAALLGGWLFGWAWLDPAMGIVGAVLIGAWARGLIVETGGVLLDREMHHPVVEEIRQAVQAGSGDARVTDLHVWRVGRNAYACAMTVVAHEDALTADAVRARLSVHEEIVHSTIEIHRCPETPAAALPPA